MNYPDPLVLIGTDLLCSKPSLPVTFECIGIDPKSQQGQLVFYVKNTSDRVAINLVEWPRCKDVAPKAGGGEQKGGAAVSTNETQVTHAANSTPPAATSTSYNSTPAAPTPAKPVPRMPKWPSKPTKAQQQ